MFRRFVSFLVVVFFISLNFPPAFADGLIAPLGDIASFADWAIDKVYWMFGRTPAGLLDEDICVGKDAGMAAHHSFVKMNTSVGGQQGIYYVCEYCGKEAGEVLEEAESEYVASLPAQTVTSDGGLIWQATFNDVSGDLSIDYEGYNLITLTSPDFSYNDPNLCHIVPSSNYILSCFFHGTSLYGRYFKFGIENFFLKAPVDGTYIMLAEKAIDGYFLLKGNRTNQTYFYSQNVTSYGMGQIFSVGMIKYLDTNNQVSSANPYTSVYDFYLPAFEVTPFNPVSVNSSSDSDVYNIGTRAASITGNYGVVNSGGTVSQIESQSIVNEGQHTVYNPVTNETENFTDWTYDYSTRTYTLTQEGGTETTVTYGDEYVTYSSGGNTTNIYYITNVSDNGGDSGNSGEGNTPTHVHSYSSEVTTEPTCTRSGVRTYTCTCGATYTESIPANKHNWQVVQDVKNEFDAETGELLQQGYTVYQCSVCGQQYRQDDESLPPGVIGQNTDLMEVGENGQSLISSFSGLYDGYLSLVTSLFPYLPEEIRKFLYLGITSVVSLGIYKGIRR